MRADTGAASLPVTVALCQTNPVTGACLSAPASSVTTAIPNGATPTFAFFVTAAGSVAFDPAVNRVFVPLKARAEGVGSSKGLGLAVGDVI